MLRKMKVVLLFASLVLVAVANVVDDVDYGELKCDDESGQCTCYNKDGKPVYSSPDLKACKCLVQKDETKKNGYDDIFPIKCTKDGKYRRLQCQWWNDECFYVNTNTGAYERITDTGCIECYRADCLNAN